MFKTQTLRRLTMAATLAMSTMLAACNTAPIEKQSEYNAYITAVSGVNKAQAEADAAKHLAEQERLRSLYQLSYQSPDANTRASAFTALLLSGQGGVSNRPQSVIQIAPPAPPVNTALEWAKVLVNPLTTIGTGVLNYRLGVVQSDNSTATELNRWDTIKEMNRVGVEGAGKVVSPAIVTGVEQTVTPAASVGGTTTP